MHLGGTCRQFLPADTLETSHALVADYICELRERERETERERERESERERERESVSRIGFEFLFIDLFFDHWFCYHQ
jgi:hypothetical protein